MTKPPIFILGVPRSGTTLLRTLLDSHSAIACGPETPWLGGHQPRSVMELWRFLREHKLGYCKSFGVDAAVVDSAVRDLVCRLMEQYARSKGKARWAEKTPDNLLHLGFLLHLFPDARLLLIVRDGLDVAVSTSVIDEHRRGISSFHEQHLQLGAGAPPVPNNPFNALVRWRHWNNLIDQSLHSREHLRISYERLVLEPEATVRQVAQFVGEPFEPAMLNYAQFPHDYPSWEWGSADVRARASISSARVGRARKELPAPQLRVLAPLAEPGGDVPAAAALASVREIELPEFRQFMDWVNALAGSQSLQQFTDWSKVWEYPWLWFNALQRLVRPGTRVVDLGSALSPIPWLCALLGARITLVETTARFVPIWTRLRDTLRVNVDWHITESERIPLPDASADALTSFSVIEHQPDKDLAVAEAVRILKPGGSLCMSFDVAEPSSGSGTPPWNGKALSLEEFERLIWLHPAFANAARPRWNLDDAPAFLEWHRRSAPHHTYAVAAAVVSKRAAPLGGP